jgi:translation initiation factor 2D
MFKKHPRPKPSANIKSSERRKLVNLICHTYNIDQDKLSKDQVNAIVPSTIKQANFNNQTDVSGIIYFNENETPVWFKSRDSQVYPSVFTVWNLNFLPVVKTHPHVISVLSNGADLMLPGTVPPFDKGAVKGAIVGVVDSANPTVVKAVGVCCLDVPQFTRVVGHTGVAVRVIHHVDDELYKLNTLVDIPMPTEVPMLCQTNEIEGSVAEEDGDIEPDSEAVETEQMKDESPQSVNNENCDDISLTIDGIAESVSTLTVEEVDNFFTRSLLQTIKNDTFELPITASTFMSQHIYKNLPAIDPSYCNVKKTSWKKTSKFLKAMDKLKYILVKGKDEDLSIIKLMDKANPTIETFVPHRTMGSLKSVSTPPTPSKKANELTVQLLHKPTSKSKPVFVAIKKPYDKYYTATELRTILQEYISLQQLVNERDKKQILINDTLRSITNLKESSVTRDVVFKAFLKNFSPHYQIIKPGENSATIYKGEPPKVSIITETKIGRKVITRVSNFEHFYIKPHLLSDELKVKCSGSATIGPCVQNPKLTEVQVQGPHGKLIIQLLKDKGIPISYINFEDKLKKKKKKAT